VTPTRGGGDVVFNKCETCNEKYELLPENTIIYLPIDRTYMDHLVMECPEGHEELMFFTQDSARDQFLLKHDHLPIIRGKATKEAIRYYETLFEITLLDYVEIIPRHEGEIRDLAILLDVTPTEWLMEIFASPPPKGRWPLKWL
jgi:hypothetical protein